VSVVMQLANEFGGNSAKAKAFLQIKTQKADS
jgi:hypothetical protein